jgi:hypothetical protein
MHDDQRLEKLCMTKPSDENPSVIEVQEPERKALSPAAERALAEAAARRAAAERAAADKPTEVDGPKGPEPTRYGDWEKGGIASDF